LGGTCGRVGLTLNTFLRRWLRYVQCMQLGIW
jgi:hypothetical protein